MENVPEVIGANNVQHFNKWLSKLESLGYSNFFDILNAKDYGIPQNRRRCFMVSILGDFAYDFPLKVKLKYRLKDFLEKQVDEKYYLDEKDLERISNWKSQENPLENAIDIERERERVMPTLTARGAGEEHAGMKLIKIGNYGNGHHAKDVFDSEGVSPTITTGNHGLGQTIVDKKSSGGGLPIMENTKKGYRKRDFGHRQGNVHNETPLGSIKTATGGYEVIKVKQGSKAHNYVDGWTTLANYKYEQYHNKKVGEKEMVIFANGNKRDYRKENLVKITWSERLQLNQAHAIGDEEYMRTMLEIIRAKQKIREVANER